MENEPTGYVCTKLERLNTYLDSCVVKRNEWIIKTKLFYLFMGAFLATLFSFTQIIVYGNSQDWKKPLIPIQYYEETVRYK
jgi:hypothetical protein